MTLAISYINVQKSTDFKSQEKRERKTLHACSWGGGGGGEADWQKDLEFNQEKLQTNCERPSWRKKPLELSDIF